MNVSKSLATGALVVFALSSSSEVRAQTQQPVIVGRNFASSLVFQQNGDQITFRADAGSSYCCEAYANAAATLVFSNSIEIHPNVFDSPTTVTARFAGTDNPQMPAESSRVCFVVPANVPSPLAVLTTSYNGTFPTAAQVACDETTLYTGFNTSVTDFNFLEMTNTQDAVTFTDLNSRVISTFITATNTVPAPDVTAIDNQSYVVPAGSRVDADIHTAAGGSAFGPLKITHTGAPGSIKAALVQYNITSTSPLKFAPVAREDAVPRSVLAGISR